MGGLVRRPPGAQNSSSANASESCHTKTRGGAHQSQFSPLIQTKLRLLGAKYNRLWKQRMSLLQTRPAFSDVTTIGGLGQNQRACLFLPVLTITYTGCKGQVDPKPDLCRNKLVTLLSLPLSKARSNMKRLVYGQTTQICFMRKTLCSGGKVSFSPVLYRLLRNYMQQRMMGDGRWFSFFP